MSSPPPQTGPAATNDALAADLISIRNSLTTPETVGRTLTYFALTEAVTKGHQIDADTFEIPFTLTTKVERRMTDDGTATVTHCSHHAISAFGHVLISWDSCTTSMVVTTGTGTAHTGTP